VIAVGRPYPQRTEVSVSACSLPRRRPSTWTGGRWPPSASSGRLGPTSPWAWSTRPWSNSTLRRTSSSWRQRRRRHV